MAAGRRKSISSSPKVVPDVCPAGDLAVQIEIGRLLGLPEKPTEKHLREVAEAWRPYRGAAAVLAWHSYNSSVL